jgi:hypothetical protein
VIAKRAPIHYNPAVILYSTVGWVFLGAYIFLAGGFLLSPFVSR